MKRILKVLLSFVVLLFLVGCSNNYKYNPEKVNVTTTTNIIKDLVLQIGGDKVNVYTLMGPGVDPHQYVARPSDYNALSNADLIVASGLHLEGKMVGILDSYKNQSNKEILIVGDEIATNSADELKSLLILDESFGDNYDPHFWFDIDLYKEAARYVYLKLSEIDNNNQNYYEERYSIYLNELDNLSLMITNMLDDIEPKDRYLISSHDAFQYFGNKYQFKVYSLQGLSTEDEVSPSDIIEIVDVVTENNVKAIFPETSVPIETIKSVEEVLNRKGYEIVIGDNLYSDSLGDQNDDDTYIKMYLKNVTTIINAFEEEERS